MAPKNVIPLLYIALICTMFFKTNTFSLPMIPIDSPHLQMFPQKLTTEQRFELLMNITMSRASLHSSAKSRYESSSNASINSIESPVYYMLNNYYATQIFFGTANNLLSAYVLLDTGSANTWVQCEGCNPCFELKGGNIPIKSSITYQILTKDDPRCNPRKVINNQWCAYETYYGSGSHSNGPVGSDTFIFINSETKGPDAFKDIVFGCGLRNFNINFGPNTGPNNFIAGIYGLSPGPQSFLNQLDATTKGRFSYCLTSWAEENVGMSTLNYGDSAQIGNEPDVQTIKMNINGIYHLSFRGISVDEKRLPNIDASICPLDENKIEGFIIDSGAPVTALPQPAYQTLRDAVTTYFDRYGWLKAKQPYFDLCYTLPPGQTMDTQQFPKVVFHFENGDGSGSEVDWVIPRDNIFVKFDTIKGFCMAAAVYGSSNSKLCLFGAYQQANFKILFDVKNGKLSFKPQRCQENL